MTSRRRFLVSAAAGTASLVAYGHWWEPRWLALDHVRCPVPGLGKGQRIRILQLSDLHASSFVPLQWIDRAVAMGLELKPDVVCLTGDYISGVGDQFDAVEYARVLRRLPKAAPTLAVLGNHDGGLWSRRHRGLTDTTHVRNILERAEVELLHNRRRVVEFANGRAVFVGVGDHWAKEVDGAAAFADIGNVAEPVVLLAHNPDTKDKLNEQWPWQLMLSGHTHGGQVSAPLYGTPFAPVDDQRYIEGLKQWNGRWIQVTRGVGTTLPIRLNCRPQVSVIDLVPQVAEV